MESRQLLKPFSSILLDIESQKVKKPFTGKYFFHGKFQSRLQQVLFTRREGDLVENDEMVLFLIQLQLIRKWRTGMLRSPATPPGWDSWRGNTLPQSRERWL